MRNRIRMGTSSESAAGPELVCEIEMPMRIRMNRHNLPGRRITPDVEIRKIE